MTVHEPAGEAELAELVAKFAASRTGIEIRAGGTRAGIGHPVDATEQVSVSAMSGIALYEPAALTVVARAGTPVAEVEEALASEGQHLPFEPADYRKLLATSGEPTIGGIFAAGISGPRRIQVGACRDAAIGVRFVSGSGEVLKSGGRVMKNVTGYDLVKLLCGSFGTLGVVTEIAFKLLPKPEKTAVLSIEGLADDRAVEALSKALSSPYGVTGAAHVRKGRDGTPSTLIRLEGFEASVDYRAEKLRDDLAGFGDFDVETDPERTTAAWQWVRDVEAFAGRPGAVWKISLKPTDAPALVAGIARQVEAEALYDWGGGLVWLMVPEEGDCSAAIIRSAVSKTGGHATLLRASDEIRRAVPVFQPEAPAVSMISQGLRRQFDPDGILNPGRMTGACSAKRRTK